MNNPAELILLVIAALLVLLALHLSKRRGGHTRAAKLMKQYATITQESLDAIPEDELVDAIVSRILAKTEEARTPNPVKTLAEMPHGNTVVYSVWAVCKELAVSDYTMLVTTATRELVEPAREALSAIGATACAEALETMRQAHAAGEDYADAEAAFHRAVEEECPLALCGDFIRDHAEDFIDG